MHLLFISSRIASELFPMNSGKVSKKENELKIRHSSLARFRAHPLNHRQESSFMIRKISLIFCATEVIIIGGTSETFSTCFAPVFTS
jgi:hypothetical protein